MSQLRSQMEKTLRKALRPHEFNSVLKLLKVLQTKQKTNTLTLYRALKYEEGFKNLHSFYRQLRFCLQHRLIELVEVKNYVGIPTKIYALTEKGKQLIVTFEGKL